MTKKPAEFIPLNIAVLTVSDTRSLDEDTSGSYLVEQIKQAGHNLAERKLITDDIYHIRAVISDWIANADIHAIITTGGTGFYIRDSMPEAVSVLFDKQIAGFGFLPKEQQEELEKSLEKIKTREEIEKVVKEAEKENQTQKAAEQQKVIAEIQKSNLSDEDKEKWIQQVEQAESKDNLDQIKEMIDKAEEESKDHWKTEKE